MIFASEYIIQGNVMKKMSQRKRNQLIFIWSSLDTNQYNGKSRAMERMTMRLLARRVWK